MVENNDKGRQARRYFIDCERRAMAAEQPTPINPEPPSIQSHFQGGRWLVHMDQRGNLIFNPVDPEAFHVPAREFPAVISSAEFPSRLLPMVLAAAAERMVGVFDRRQRHPVGPSTATQPIPLAQPAAEEHQAARYVGDPWQGPIEEWLIGRSLVTSHQILSDCLRIELARQTRSDQTRVGNIMVQLKDWTKKNVYFPETGKQRWAYVRVERAVPESSRFVMAARPRKP